jgi:hypothetical protein
MSQAAFILRGERMGLLKVRQLPTDKGVELYEEIHLPLEVLDAQIFRCLGELGYSVRGVNDAGSGPYFPALVRRASIVTVVRQQTTMGSVVYHWQDDVSGKLDAAKRLVSALGNAEIVALPDGWLEPLGGCMLSKVRANVTKFQAVAPFEDANCTQEELIERYRKNLELTTTLIDRLAQDGYWKIEGTQLQEDSAVNGRRSVTLNVPTLPPDKYSARRQQVLQMTVESIYSEEEIAKAIKESRDIVHNDKAWLKRKGYLSKPTQT